MNYKKLKNVVKKKLSCSAHQYDHVERVYKLALYIAKHEKGVDMDILKMSTILHDIARVAEDKDQSGRTDHAVLGAEIGGKLLQSFGIPKEDIEKVQYCIRCHRSRTEDKPTTIEAQILFDADKIDILGAVGIARSFMIAGMQKQSIWVDASLDLYVKTNLYGGNRLGRIKDISKHSPNIEYENRIKYLYDELYTKTGRKKAKERSKFMEAFFTRLEQEIKGQL